MSRSRDTIKQVIIEAHGELGDRLPHDLLLGCLDVLERCAHMESQEEAMKAVQALVEGEANRVCRESAEEVQP